MLDVIRAIRKEVGNDFHLQFKISAIDYNNAVTFWEKPGNTLADSIQVCQWAEEAGADAVHVSTGSLFPHLLNPIGDFPFEIIRKTYDTMLSSGIYTIRNYLLFRYWLLRPIFALLWNRVKKSLPPQPLKADEVKDTQIRKLLEANQGRNLMLAAEIKKHVNIPVLCTGGFQQASYIRKAINDMYCDAVTIARPLIANNDLVHDFAFREVPTYYESAEEHFKYGSIGTEQAQGVPYWIWLVLPRIFPDKLPRAGGLYFSGNNMGGR